ncbi:DNA polymerase phi-domain-containing protein [Mycotypha africana]|uniref:DNA polymerase phi-domain-containing protein n=1 Tax=Mycotypha africana TaxID=64632 RepID=UPI0023009332|nr:DNA polymerase phi-domain-containing protein [Mycotypha africana]KAI8990992.1 DNA polymerase phi-domain-containing protein [Mycotypha africana]
MATTTLQLYWDLASFDATARQTAAAALIKSLSDFQAKHEESLEATDKVADTEEKLDLLCASDVSYAVRRLLRGLSSSRQGARQGFSLALTELLAIVDCLSIKLVLDLLFKFTERTKSMSGEEIRDVLFGRLFGLQSIVAAGMIARSSTTTADIIRIVESLHEMATTKSYLAEVCHHVVINMLSHFKDTKHQDEVVEKIKALFLDGPVSNVDQLNLIIGMQQKLNNVDLSTQLAKWKNHNILHPANLKLLSNILKEIPSETQEALAQWKPQLHSVWDPILNMYFSENKPKNIASFQEFWTVAVDNSMFDRDASHGRKYWGFQLVEKVLRRLSSEQMPLIFTSNFMRTFINNLASEDRFLNRAARHTAQVIQTVAEENKQVGFALITQLLGQHGSQHFDRITKTKTVENLLTTMDTEGIQFYLEYLAHTFIECSSDEDEGEKMSEASRDWALNQFTLLMTNSKIPKNESWITELIRFFLIHSFFDINSSATNGKKKKSDSKEGSYWTGLYKPTPALSQATIRTCQQKFQSILVALSKLAPTEKISAGTPIKTRKLNGMTNDGELWAYKVFDIYQSLKKDKKLVSHVHLEKETAAVINEAVKKVMELRSKMEKIDKNEWHDSVERGFEILLLNLILHTLINEEEGVSVLSEITDCYDKIFASAAAASKRSTKKTKKEQEEPSDANEEQPDPIDVIVDILVSFLTSESPVLKNLAEQVFEIFSHKLTKQSLENLIAILAGDDKQGDDIFDDDEEDLDDDVEMMDMDDVDMVDENEEEEEDEDDEEVDEELRQKVEEAMKAQGINATEDSDEEEDLDDDAMAAFDEKLAEVFKQKKLAKQEGKTMQQNIVQFKNNVMELLVIYARKNPTNPLVLNLIVPLLNIIRDTPAKSVTNQFVTKVIAFLKTRLPKSHEYPKDQHNDDVFAILQAVHDFAKQSTSKDTSEMCVQLSLYLRKCILGGADFEVTDSTLDKKTKKALERFIAIYSDSTKFYLGTKSTSFSANIIQQLLQRYPLNCWDLLDTLATYLNRANCANAYRLSMVTKWISLIVQRTVGKKNEAYNQKFIELAPKLVESILATIDLSLKDDSKGLEYENMKLYLRFIALLIRLYKKVAPEAVDVNKVWKTESILSITNNEKYSKPAISALCKQIQQ